MKLIPISEIEIDDRIRKAFNENELGALADSIARLGLLHAPILNEGRLVCGGRRLKAIQLLPVFGHKLTYQGIDVADGYVPYTELGNSNEETIMEAELEENLMREDLSPQEEAAARAGLHRLRVLQNPEQTRAETAVELSKPGAKVVTSDIRDALLMEEHSNVPAVAKAKSKKEAMKIITRLKRDEHNSVLAAEFMLKTEDGSIHELLHGDMLEEMCHLTKESIDVICTDPPYGIDAQNFNAQEGIKHEYNDTRENFERIIEVIAVQGYRVCKRQGHIYLFHDFANWGFIRQCMERAGWRVWPRPIIWSKGNGLLARPDHGPRYTYECVLFANKGDRKVTTVAPDVIDLRTLTKQKRGAEKSAVLYHDLLARSVRPGDTVLDPCCGLGAIFPAATELNCKATGIEIDSAAVGYALSRMELNLEQDAERRSEED